VLRLLSNVDTSGLMDGEIARRYRFTVGAVRDWEQGHYQSDQAAAPIC
jgi:DNA-binding transcriptional regulator YiaG